MVIFVFVLSVVFLEFFALMQVKKAVFLHRKK